MDVNLQSDSMIKHQARYPLETHQSKRTIQSNPDKARSIPRIANLALRPRKPRNKNLLPNFIGNSLVKRNRRYPQTPNICGNINVPLGIVIKSNTATEQFPWLHKHTQQIFLLYAKNSALTIITYSCKKPFTATG
jgi:hypothetical protein